MCIAQGYVLGDNRRPREFLPAQYFKTQAEMAELFADLPEALENSVEIARRCAFEFTLGKSRLPDFPTPHGESIEDYLRARRTPASSSGLCRLYPDAKARGARRESATSQRLEFEVKTIIQMGFAGYFLIVADFINWAKTHGVPVGPGRGSGAGSPRGVLARHHRPRSAALRPALRALPQSRARVDARLRHRLLPGRARPRDRLREARSTARRCVSQIVTFGTMAAKAVVRDVGRVLSMPYGEVDRIAKLIPFELGITLEKALVAEPQLKALMNERGGSERS